MSLLVARMSFHGLRREGWGAWISGLSSMMSVRGEWEGDEVENGERAGSPDPFLSRDLSLRKCDEVAPDAADEGRCTGPPSTGDEEVGKDEGTGPSTRQSELRERGCEAAPDGSKLGTFRAFVCACSGVTLPARPDALEKGWE
jgi:hypothetical protein